MPDAGAPRPRGICGPRDPHDNPAPSAPGRRTRIHRRRLRHPLAGKVRRARPGNRGVTEWGALRLTPEILLAAYATGIFPMGESADDPELFWVDPKRRGILPLDAFHVPKRLRRVVRHGGFEIRCDTAFAAVIRGCAE